jgi:hypothetical protein
MIILKRMYSNKSYYRKLIYFFLLSLHQIVLNSINFNKILQGCYFIKEIINMKLIIIIIINWMMIINY